MNFLRILLLSYFFLATVSPRVYSKVITANSPKGSIIIENIPPKEIDWSEGKTKALPLLTGKLQIDKPIAKSGDSIQLTLTANNLGNGTAHRLKAKLTSDEKAFSNQTFWFGKILPDKKKTSSITIPLEKSAKDKIINFKITFSELNNNEPASIDSKIIVRTLPQPEFAYTFRIVDGSLGNGDGLFQKGETINLQLRIQNIGLDSSKNAYSNISLENIIGISVNKTEIALGKIPEGYGKNAVFTITAKENVSVDGLKIKVAIGDNFFNAHFKDTITLPLYKKTSQKVVFAEAQLLTSKEASIFSGPDFLSPVIATTKKTILLDSTGRIGEWYRVTVPIENGPQITAWIETTLCKESNITNQVTLKQLSKPAVLKYYKIPPRITLLAPLDGSTVLGNQMKIRGKVTDEKEIAKVSFFVNNKILQTPDGDAVLVPEENSDKRLINFIFPVELERNETLISVVAENTDGLVSERSRIVFTKQSALQADYGMTIQQTQETTYAVDNKEETNESSPTKKKDSSLFLILFLLGMIAALAS